MIARSGGRVSVALEKCPSVASIKFGKMPNSAQAGAHSAVTNCLKAVQAEKTDAAAAVVKRLKTMPINTSSRAMARFAPTAG